MFAIPRFVLLVAALLIGGRVHGAMSDVRVVKGRVSVRFVNTPLETAVDRLAASVGADVEWLGAAKGATVSTDLSDVSIPDALERVLRPHSYFVVTAGETGALRRVVVMPGEFGARRAVTVPGFVPASPTGQKEDTFPYSDALGASVLARLDDPDPVVRRSVLDYLRTVGPDDPRRGVVLSRLLSDPDRELRAQALELHGGFGPARNRRRRAAS
jgi:hypothetical protein